MAEDYLQTRLDFLQKVQNPDGGWGYFPGKKSWLEPTTYAMLALHGQAPARGRLGRAWAAIRSWQAADGGWRPGPAVEDSSWGTALAVTLHCVLGAVDEPFHRGVRWLCQTRGQEGTWWKRVVNRLQPTVVAHDASLQGWPWMPANSSWVEPTAHSLLALKKAMQVLKAGPEFPQARERIDMAEKMMLDRQCADGGWNYGNRLVQDVKLPSYPETTAVALLGLQGNAKLDLRRSLEWARAMWGRSNSPLAKAWLSICLRNYGQTLPPGDAGPPGDDIQLAALEALGAPGGNFALLRAEVHS